MELNKIQTATWDELVFEGRNKSYGAFFLRQIYNKHVIRGGIISLLIFVVGMGGPVLWKIISPSFDAPKPKMVVMEMKDLKPPPPPDKTPPPPPPPPPPPVKSTIRFVPPVIKKDEEVHEDPPKQEEMVKVQVSDKTEKGTDNGVDKIEVDPNAGKETGPEENKIYTVVEVNPAFPGGDDAFRDAVSNNFNYPQRARDNQTEGRVVVQFVVSPTGDLNDFKILRDIGDGCGEEAVNAIKKVIKSKKWSPGKQGGKAVSVYYTFPFELSLQ